MRGGRIVLIRGGQIVLMPLATDAIDRGAEALPPHCRSIQTSRRGLASTIKSWGTRVW
jgi:hypothetical protein